MLWDPKGFPTMIYELNKEEGGSIKETMPMAPLSMRLRYKMMVSLQALGLFIPKNLSKVKDMKKMSKYTMVDRMKLEKTVQKLQHSRLFKQEADPAKYERQVKEKLAPKLAKLVAAKGIVLGSFQGRFVST